MPKAKLFDQTGHSFWPKWFLRAYDWARRHPSLHGVTSGAITLLPVQRVRPLHRPELRAALEGAGEPWHAILEEAEVRLAVDMHMVVATAAADTPLRSWALDALCASAEYLSRRDDVLAVLLQRRIAGQSSGALEELLLQEHVARLAYDPGRIDRWASAIRRAIDPLVRRSDQLSPPGATVVVDLGNLNLGSLRIRCKTPTYPAPAKKRGNSDLAREAQWLLSCDSARDGARRDGGVIVVNLPAYLSVARALGRRVACDDQFELPRKGAARDAWFAAGTTFGNLLIERTSGRWASRHHPVARAAQMGWVLDPSVPLLALNADAVEVEAGGRTPALPTVAASVPSRRGFRSVLELHYEDRPVLVTRRYVPRTKENRLYFELPFDPPDTFERRAYHRITWRKKELWCLRDINVLAEHKWPGAEPFAEFARQQSRLLEGDQFLLEVAKRKTFQRAADVDTGVALRMGALTAYEREVVRQALEKRPPGPLTDDFWEQVCTTLPKRTMLGVRRSGLRILQQEANRLGAPAFRQSPFWPGRRLGDPILRRIPRRRDVKAK